MDGEQTERVRNEYQKRASEIDAACIRFGVILNEALSMYIDHWNDTLSVQTHTSLIEKAVNAVSATFTETGREGVSVQTACVVLEDGDERFSYKFEALTNPDGTPLPATVGKQWVDFMFLSCATRMIETGIFDTCSKSTGLDSLLLALSPNSTAPQKTTIRSHRITQMANRIILLITQAYSI